MRGCLFLESQSKENNRNIRKNMCLEFKGFILCRIECVLSESVQFRKLDGDFVYRKDLFQCILVKVIYDC